MIKINDKIGFYSEPRRGSEFFYLGSKWQIVAVTHHGGSKDYTLSAVNGGLSGTFEAFII